MQKGDFIRYPVDKAAAYFFIQPPGMEKLRVYDTNDDEEVGEEFREYLQTKNFACIAAKAAVAKKQLKCFVAGHIACPASDHNILQFLYSFIDGYRASGEMYHSAAVIFKSVDIPDEQRFEEFLWSKLQVLSDMDAKNYPYDQRVNADPSSADFSFSLKQEAFFIIGLHPESTRLTRQFLYPVIVFNPHAQFEQLRESGKYEAMKTTVRKRDQAVSGSINPMLRDYGEASEVYQYSGKQYDESWQCPLKIKHAGI